IGDSITHWWDKAGKAVWDEYYAKRNALNLAISGDRTEHVLWRLNNGELRRQQDAKVVVIMIGTNNAGSNSPAEIADGVKVIVQQIRKKSPATQILLLAVFPRGTNNDDARRKVNQGANAIFKTLDDGKHVHYLDIGKHFLQQDGTLTREIMPDLLHLSPKGYTIWAESIEKPLAKLLAE
ncbi:MAG TPA: GDSL family lipase, partial [Planctomycetaceae bacterium]|nr:GDSL family lipase [Planctomycetaceae bacterium]